MVAKLFPLNEKELNSDFPENKKGKKATAEQFIKFDDLNADKWYKIAKKDWIEGDEKKTRIAIRSSAAKANTGCSIRLNTSKDAIAIMKTKKQDRKPRQKKEQSA